MIPGKLKLPDMVQFRYMEAASLVCRGGNINDGVDRAWPVKDFVLSFRKAPGRTTTTAKPAFQSKAFDLVRVM